MTIFDVNYFTKKYGLARAHSEVISATGFVKPGKALDLGCGNGRNSLYLAAKGYDITAWDRNPISINNIEHIRAAEGFTNLKISIQDLNTVEFDGNYDFIFSTVVMMFLKPSTIPRLIDNMQRCTRPGGHNLIVSVMDTYDYPCADDFSFTFKCGELSGYYNDWELLKYNENIGELHRTDATGNRIKLRFATLFAQK